MIAYPKKSIEAIRVHESLDQWKKENLISIETAEKIGIEYKKELYSPNLFIRIALFIFTCILLSASFGLITLMIPGGESETGIAIRLIIYSGMAFFALEFFINNKKAYRAGIDDAILYTALSLLLSGMGLIVMDSAVNTYGERLFFLLAFPVLSFAAFRYVDMLLTALSFACLLVIIFLHLNLIGGVIQSLLPFIGMAVAIVIYIQSRKYQNKKNLNQWNNLFVLEFLSLLLFYFSGNYFVVREMSIALLDLELQPGEDIPLAIVFYAFTLMIPVLYLIRSIQTKDRMMLRTGLLILAIGVLTFKYYFSLGHHEITLTLSGIIMISVAYTVMKYLSSPRNGFTSKEDKSLVTNDMEAYIISESLGKQSGNKGGDDFKFEGGGSGGGGSTGKF